MQASTAVTQANPEHGDQLANLRVFLRYVMQTCTGGFLEKVDELELSLSQLKALQVLRQADDISLKTLGDSLGLSLPAISRAVEGLVRREFVTRTEDTEDRRIKRVRATAEGRHVVDHLLQLRMDDLARFHGSLPARDRSRLDAALKPIVARDEVAAAASGRTP